MPNVGMPSNACRTCKTRRVRCDAGRPTCARCATSGRTCGGYAHGTAVDLIFKDQTLATARKAAQRSTRSTRGGRQAHQSRTSGSQSNALPNNDAVDSAGLAALSRPLHDASHSLESRVLVFFLDNMSLSISSHDALRIFLNPSDSHTEASDGVLNCSLQAVALGAAWKIAHDKSRRAAALAKYVSAMRSIEKALSDPQSSTSDEVLLSVKLLELFECLSSTDPSNHAWARHVVGSVSLVQWRGEKNFETPMGRSLFHSVRFITIMTCIHYSEQVRSYRDGQSWTDSHKIEEHAHVLMQIAIDVAALKKDARDTFDGGFVSPDGAGLVDILSRIHELDCCLIDWQQSLPDSWKSYRVTIEDDRGERVHRAAWEDHVYVHANVWISAHVTTFHVLRLHVNAMRLRVLREVGLSAHSSQATRRCADCIQSLADMICACVAPAIGDIVPKEKVPAGIKLDDISGRAVYVKMWLLATVARLESISAEQRQWVINRMAIMSTRYGLNMANILSHWPADLIGQDLSEPDGKNQRKLFIQGIEKK